MSIPASIRGPVEEALARAGFGGFERAAPVGGGCINETVRVEATGGGSAFLKWNGSAPPDFFPAEARGLEILRHGLRAGGLDSLRVPEVLGICGEDEPGWLLLEFVEAGPPTPDFWRGMGTGLARLHRGPAPEGLDSPNYIGPLEQDNRLDLPWPAFWVERRLEPQFRLATDSGHLSGGDGRAFLDLLARAGDLVPDLRPDQLGLLHGDLWSGNVFPDRAGRAVLVDPAVYRGDPRVDLAMAELFGGFGDGFRLAYDEATDPGPEYQDALRDLYQLYPLLVHVNLFGGSYLPGVMERVGRLSRL